MAKAQTQDQTQYYNREFCWNYGGETWTWNLTIPVALYEAYVSVPDSVRSQIQLSGFGYFTTTDDSYMQNLAQKINETATAEGYSSLQEANFALAFVQSIPYATDLNSTGYQDYPRFPVETLIDNVGDCKSHSVLFATLTLMLGFDVVFINPPDHLAVGVLGNNLGGTYWTYNNQDYYYCETTGEGFTVGQLPTQFNGVGAYVYPIDTSEQYVVNVQSLSLAAPDPSYAPYNPNAPQITPNPNQTAEPFPTVAAPTIHPVTPISLNLILEDPLLFVFIITAIGLSIAIVVRPVRIGVKTAPQQTVSPEPSSRMPEQAEIGKTKFCIYCGTSNKSFATYCGNCGKKIDVA
jgi:predicted transglutaminase-like cysteine proteinase